MISERRAKELILKSLKNVKDSDPSYRELELNDNTIVLGNGGSLDSIAFTVFATDLEEKIEDETGKEYVLKVDEILAFQEGKSAIVVGEMARVVSRLVNRD